MLFIRLRLLAYSMKAVRRVSLSLSLIGTFWFWSSMLERKNDADECRQLQKGKMVQGASHA
jgi:hypothetical protein